MKKIIKLGIFVLAVAVISSCSKWIDPEININPDAPITVPMGLITPSVQTDLAYTLAGGNDVCRPQAMWMQQLTGIARQSEAQGRYLFRSNNVSNLWATVYSGIGMDLNNLKTLAAEKESPHIAGMAQVLMALNLGITTDLWGDIPYTEAFQGKENLTPSFDSQESIYTAIQSLLDEGIANLSSADNAVDIAGDYIYGGDIASWVNAANALKARYYLHLSEVDNANYAKALASANAALDGGFSGMKFSWGESESGANPLYQFLDQRGDVVMGSTLIDLMVSIDDPRLPAYATLTKDSIPVYRGSTMIDLDASASAPGSAIASINSPTYFISKAEVEFIKAEALLGTDEASAKASLKAAMTTSMSSYKVDGAAWVESYAADNIDSKSGNDLLKELITQKYIALFYQQEVWTDFRRTNNIMGLTKNPNAEIDFPVRFPYAQSSIDYNPNTPDLGELTNKLWWDK